TNGIDKPVLNVFRMLGRMSGRRVWTSSAGALPIEDVRDRSVRAAADVAAFATADARSAAVLVWNYHDDDLPGAASEVDLTISGLPAERASLTHYRVDADHSNAYTVWQQIGSPQSPTAAQLTRLEAAGRLQTLGPPSRVALTAHRVAVSFSLPRQAVSLVKLDW
ncbi:MAG: beta-xylosidase, partial [Acidobacteria bacterium]